MKKEFEQSDVIQGTENCLLDEYQLKESKHPNYIPYTDLQSDIVRISG